jgi:hypothetical protein
MSGCGGNCLPVKAKSVQLEEVKQEAKQYAIQHQKTVAIYKEGNDYFFAEAEFAHQSGYAIVQYISHNH